ncbi:MAG: family 10 glycosylhydrolase, partial [Clostridia bacterium]|nr:family 10 glycosylhydrolase [Clostridia bacterium]
DVDGIHFDDYFYPTSDTSFDEASFKKYSSFADEPLSLEDWRRANVNALISGCYTAIKFINKDIKFSISPMASLEKNYNELYADVKAWVENGCIDVIIPQLYFGFEYPESDFTFENLLVKWKDLIEPNSNVQLMIGLAPYKIGTETPADKEEWGECDDIIARQAKMCIKDQNISGYVLFSESSLFSENDLNKRQMENLLKIICET